MQRVRGRRGLKARFLRPLVERGNDHSYRTLCHPVGVSPIRHLTFMITAIRALMTYRTMPRQ